MTGARRIVVFLLGLALVASPVSAELEKNLVKRQSLDETPVDIAQSVSDGRLFVLLEGGNVQIFSPDGVKQERFKVGDGVTSLAVSPDGQRLYLGNAKSKELQFVDLSYVQKLPVNNSATKGATNAPVTIVIFDDFQCPYCARLVPTLDKVVATYSKQVQVVYKHFPLSMHKFAESAAIASLAARNQGKFWPLHDKLFANYNKLNDVMIRELAESVGLDMARFDKDIVNPALRQEIAADTQLGTQAGVRGTPAVYINGKQLKDRSFKGFKQMIDSELKRAGK
ncbi:MAG: thioredoxin domain-containing protein [Deltaproteobacteria bacterium]|nr:thioredoxin domain-containing protein [Deltaproteobacteria bacterium]